MPRASVRLCRAHHVVAGGAVVRKDTSLLKPPEPVVSQIMAFRRSLHHTERPDIPPGLSGAGPLVEDQAAVDVLAQLHEVVQVTAPIRTTFTTTAIFPHTTMVYLAPRENTPFLMFTERIVAHGIRVIPNLFIAVAIPHCTIAWFTEQVDDEIAKALQFPVPAGEFIFDTVSMYTIRPTGVIRRWTGRLQGTPSSEAHKR